MGAQAVSLLQELGYTNVRHYPGGLAEWFSETPAGAVQGPASGLRTASARPTSGAFASRFARFIDALADRSVGELFTVWLAIVAACGIAYWLFDLSPRVALIAEGTPVSGTIQGFLSAIYFSAVTATSVGYGDIVPVGPARLLAVLEGVAGLVLFGCVVSKFVSRRQEQLLADVHHIAFEDRLGRVRTNLHLVRTEVQGTARLCAGHDLTPPEAIVRIESAAMVFVGELHTVHDLLYRPQATPDEAVLEAILAGLASVFREFTELVACVRGDHEGTPAGLRVSLETMERLAVEICGDCVPRAFAPNLRVWMDQIQHTAHQLTRTGIGR